jgi:disulfide bond formation protein DsbB
MEFYISYDYTIRYEVVMLSLKYFRWIIHMAFFATLIAVLFGAYFVEFVLGHKPCALCYLQRIGMLLSAICLAINIKDPTNRSLGVCLLSSVFGAGVALRHNSLKFCCPDLIKPVILGKSLPVWSFYVFVCSMVTIAVMLVLRKESLHKDKIDRFFEISFWILSIVLIIGTTSTFICRGFQF